MFKRKKRKKQSNLNGGVKMLKSSSATVASSMVNFVLVYATELNLFVKPMWKYGPFIVIRIHLACILCFFFMLCCVVKEDKTKKNHSGVVVVVWAPTTYTSAGNTCPDWERKNRTEASEFSFLDKFVFVRTMGNVDTKLNFRKAIVQLGTKNQVDWLIHRWLNDIF